MVRGGYVYITTNKYNNVLYTGVTANLITRIYQHKTKLNPTSFTARYNVHKLVYYECFDYIEEAINREKQIKSWRRDKKIALIQKFNPQWKDLFDELEAE
jgi:putative endonuclease